MIVQIVGFKTKRQLATFYFPVIRESIILFFSKCVFYLSIIQIYEFAILHEDTWSTTNLARRNLTDILLRVVSKAHVTIHVFGRLILSLRYWIVFISNCSYKKAAVAEGRILYFEIKTAVDTLLNEGSSGHL